jgi:hypothetical protein
MRSYNSVSTQADMDRLLASIAGFHDSLAKEIHLVNRGYVRPDASMVMGHKYDAQVLIQSQWEPFAIELLFTGVQELSAGTPREYWGASGRADHIESPVEQRITMTFDSELKIVSERLYYRVRKEWLGKKTFLTSEVPSDNVVPAHTVQDGWRQCSSCSDAWEESADKEFSYCPNCEQLTQLVDAGSGVKGFVGDC